MTKDITELLYRIKVNIRDIEDGKCDSSLLDLVRLDFIELIDCIKLFLISERNSYYGYFLMNMQIRPDFRCDSIAGIKLDEFPAVFVSNPLLLCKFRLKEIIYIVCHEIDHIVFNHPAEMLKCNPEHDEELFYKFNLAADAAVNDRINFEIEHENRLFMQEPDGLITSKVLSKMFGLKNVRPMDNYAYYFSLIKDKSEKKSKKDNNSFDNAKNSMMDKLEKSEADNGNSDNSNSSDSTDKSDDIVTAKNCKKLTDHEWNSGEDFEEIANATKELVNSAFEMMNEETRGLVPGYFISEVKNINRPPAISWETVLKKYVGTITAGKRKTRTRLNRRQPERFDISGSVDEKVLKIAVAIDTSASVSDQMIAAIFNEVFAILATRKHEITVIECDTVVRRVYRVNTAGDIKKKITGRGGTAFTPVIEYVNSDRYFRDALLIYFTDGYGEDYIPRPNTYRNIWVIKGDARHLSVEEPYGMVLSM